MTAEQYIAEDMLEEEAHVSLALVEEGAADDAELAEQADDRVLHLRQSALVSIYKSPRGAVACLDEDDVVGLLNQAANLFLRRKAGDARLEAARQSLSLLGDYLGGMSVEDVAAKYSKHPDSIRSIRSRLYRDMHEAVAVYDRAGLDVQTPLSIVNARLAPAHAEIAVLQQSKSSNWRILGLCGYANPEQFAKTSNESAEAAKYICSQCVVRDECLTTALENGYDHGVWGGKTERERRQMLRGRGVRPLR